MPATPTVSVCAHSSSVRPPPAPRARTTTLGRPGVASSTSASSPAARAHSTTNPAISASPAPPGTSAGLTESMATSREISSVASACIRVGSRIAMTAGYSGTPLPRKLGIKRGHRVLLLGAPDGFADGTLGQLPEGVKVGTRARGVADVIVAFHLRRAELAKRMPALRERMDPAAGLWIAWPKRASKVETDLTEDVVRELALANTLVDNKVCAIDETWSGLRLVIRLKDR